MATIQYVCICHRGLVRKTNQDNIVCGKYYLPMRNDGSAEPLCGEKPLDSGMLFGVFDGMGGEQRGEAASYIAAETAAGWDPADGRETLRDLCMEMNRRICEYTRVNDLNTCGTTAAMILAEAEKMTGCNLGDSRIYQYRNGFMTQLSEDHVYPVYAGGKAPLLQYLGIPETEMVIEPSFFTEEVRAGDVYLICSDGLTDMLSEERIVQILISGDPPESLAEKLLGEALAAGGRDNITMILIRIR